jgi:hypothetical protein
VVLVVDAVHVGPLDSPQCSCEAARAMLALVAVDQKRVVGLVEDDVKRAVHVAALHAHSALVRIEVDLEVLNAGRLHEVAVLVRNCLRHERAGQGQQCFSAIRCFLHDGLQLQALQEFVVLRLRVAAAVDCTGQNSTVIRWREERPQPAGRDHQGDWRRSACLCEGCVPVSI